MWLRRMKRLSSDWLICIGQPVAVSRLSRLGPTPSALGGRGTAPPQQRPSPLARRLRHSESLQSEARCGGLWGARPPGTSLPRMRRAPFLIQGCSPVTTEWVLAPPICRRRGRRSHPPRPLVGTGAVSDPGLIRLRRRKRSISDLETRSGCPVARSSPRPMRSYVACQLRPR